MTTNEYVRCELSRLQNRLQDMEKRAVEIESDVRHAMSTGYRNARNFCVHLIFAKIDSFRIWYYNKLMHSRCGQYISHAKMSSITYVHVYLWLPSMDDSIRPAICVIRAWCKTPTLPVTPAQLKRPGIGRNTSCAFYI